MAGTTRFYSRTYRARLWLYRYARARDVLPPIGTVLTVVMALLAGTNYPISTAVLFTVYLISVVSHWALSLHDRQSFRSGRGQADAIWALFACINDKVFNGDPRTRFTLFIPAPGRSDFIIPWFRFQPGGTDPIKDARVSRARYQRAEGETGRAWAEAGRRVMFKAMPVFPTREQFEDHYVNQMKIPKDVVLELSDYMMKVETIICYGFVGLHDRSLGVLSVDLQAPLSEENGVWSFRGLDGEAVVPFDWANLTLLFSSVQHLLESSERL